jgi:hypothetical protein
MGSVDACGYSADGRAPSRLRVGLPDVLCGPWWPRKSGWQGRSPFRWPGVSHVGGRGAVAMCQTYESVGDLGRAHDDV